MDIFIKRYSDRKLYDTTNKHFVTLDVIAGMINAGNNVKVVNKNGEDVTDHVVSALIQKHFDHDRQLLDISGSSPFDLIKNKINMIKIKRSLDVIYDLAKLATTDKESLNKIVNDLSKEGIINAEMAIEIERILYGVLKERNIETEKRIVEEERKKMWAELSKLLDLLQQDEFKLYIKSMEFGNQIDEFDFIKKLGWSKPHFDKIKNGIIKKGYLTINVENEIEFWKWTLKETN